MSVTTFLLLQMVTLALVLYFERLAPTTADLDEQTWMACVNPGGQQ